MRAPISVFCFIFATGFTVLTTPRESVSAETMQRTVRGPVVGTNLHDIPQTIVVRVILPSKEELIVGAAVSSDAGITRGKRTVSLSDIKTGELVDITYVKNPGGLMARSIHVR